MGQLVDKLSISCPWWRIVPPEVYSGFGATSSANAANASRLFATLHHRRGYRPPLAPLRLVALRPPDLPLRLPRIHPGAPRDELQRLSSAEPWYPTTRIDLNPTRERFRCWHYQTPQDRVSFHSLSSSCDPKVLRASGRVHPLDWSHPW